MGSIASTKNSGFLLSGGSYTRVDAPFSFGTDAFGINDSGQIIGQYYNGRAFYGFLMSGGNYTRLDVPGSFDTWGQGINASGQSVGFYDDAAGTHAFLLSDGVYTTINVPGSRYTKATGINNAGEIVGYYQDASGYHGFLASPVPEPSTLLLLAIGALAMICFEWQRKGLFQFRRARPSR